MKNIHLPLTEKQAKALKAGDEVRLSGAVYTARDQAHKRLAGLIKAGKALPFDLRNQAIYYCGPTKTPRGKVIGSCGPTTSARMDEFTPVLLKAGVKAMIGKGGRNAQVIKAVRKYRAVYFVTMAGCGALLASKVVRARPLAFKGLGPEAIYELEVEDFPVIVAVDARGKNLYPSR